ncbi:unnamed protein product [Discosporangium mesarthrocarpum]
MEVFYLDGLRAIILRYLDVQDWIENARVSKAWAHTLRDVDVKVGGRNLWLEFASETMGCTVKAGIAKRLCLDGDWSELSRNLDLLPVGRCHVVKPDIHSRCLESLFRTERAFSKFLRLWMKWVPSFLSRIEVSKSLNMKVEKSKGGIATISTECDKALRCFTRYTVFCPRCRRTKTALFAQEKEWGSGPGAVKRCVLYLECHAARCGVTSEAPMPRDAQGSICFRVLMNYASWVGTQDWETVNTLPADLGVHWFSDTSTSAVQERRKEARASSHGLLALTVAGLPPRKGGTDDLSLGEVS